MRSFPRRNKVSERRLAGGIGSLLLSNGATTAALTIGAALIFKLVAFLRESYVASQFGLSPQTDAYFGFQQLPLALLTFMLGAFSLAFAPAYAETKKRYGEGEWLSVTMTYLVAGGLLLTLLTIGLTPLLLDLFGQAGRKGAAQVLLVLSLSYLPILFLGVWAGMSIGLGRNISAVLVGGLPYLVMAMSIAALCDWRGPVAINLPLSMTAGFVSVGIPCLFLLVRREKFSIRWELLRRPFQVPGLRGFARQLAGSSLENVGFAANQLVAVWFFSQAGPGSVSANNYAMRIGMLSFSLLSQPLAQLGQARLCTATAGAGEKRRVFLQYLGLVILCACGAAILIALFRSEIVSAIYLRGKFSTENLKTVAGLVPAWVSYVIVQSANGVLARYEFSLQQGSSYARRMWCAYAGNTVLRFVLHGQKDPSWIIWAAVLGEGVAFAVGFWKCMAGVGQQDSQLLIASQEAAS